MLILLHTLSLCTAILNAQTLQFNVFKGDDVVGSVRAMRSEIAGRTIYIMTSHSEFDIIWKQVVRSSAIAEYINGSLNSCSTSMRVNDAVRDSSSMVHGADRCYVHPIVPFDCDRNTEWTTARMYYEEPLSQPSIFVESVLRECPLTRSGPNTYLLTLPNKHTNRYTYLNGILQEIHIDRSFFDLVFRRVS